MSLLAANLFLSNRLVGVVAQVQQHRKRFEQYVLRNTCETPERDPEDPRGSR